MQSVMASRDDDKYLEIIRSLSTDKKLQSAFALYDFGRNRVAAEIRRQNPEIDEIELKQRVNKRFCSHD